MTVLVDGKYLLRSNANSDCISLFANSDVAFVLFVNQCYVKFLWVGRKVYVRECAG